MDGIRLRRDLAGLPEPRFLHVTPAWLRGFVAAAAAVLALTGAGAVYLGFRAPGIDWIPVGGGLVCLAAGGFILWRVLFTDWRDWIDLAATSNGLYLPGRGKEVIFIPWPDVTSVAVVRRTALEGRLSHLKLTLRLPVERWTGFSRFAPIKGEGQERSYTMSALTSSGEDLAAAIQSVRHMATKA